LGQGRTKVNITAEELAIELKNSDEKFFVSAVEIVVTP
jgi:hypothetical protein